MFTYLLPKPNVGASGTVGSKNRSGLNWSGLGYWIGSLLIALELRVVQPTKEIEVENTHHVFAMLISNNQQIIKKHCSVKELTPWIPWGYDTPCTHRLEYMHEE